MPANSHIAAANNNIAHRKAKLRRTALAHRKAIHADIRGADVALCAHFIESPCLPHQPSTIAAYVAIGSEINPALLCSTLHARGHICALPIVYDDTLIFRHWQDDTKLIRGAYGTYHPPADAIECVPDIILLPVLAFDKHGGRLGRGGGFYDRACATQSAYRIGLSFAAQEQAHIPMQPHDVRLDGIVTERGYHIFTPAVAEQAR